MRKAKFTRINYVFLSFGLIILILLIEISIRTQSSIVRSLSSLNIPDFLKNNLSAYLAFTFAVLPLLLAEIILPNEEISKDHKHGLLFWLISIQCNYFFSILTSAVVHYFKIGPVFHISFTNSHLSWN